MRPTDQRLHGQLLCRGDRGQLHLRRSGGGDVCVKSLIDLQLVVDTFGWSTGAGRLQGAVADSLVGHSRQRHLGTGPGTFGGNDQSFASPASRGVPNTADAALLTVTVADPSGYGFVTVWPCDQPLPLASTDQHIPERAAIESRDGEVVGDRMERRVFVTRRPI